MAKRTNTFVTVKSLTVGVKLDNGSNKTLGIEKGVTFIYDADEKGYVVKNPRSDDEHDILVDDATFNAWREVKAIVDPELKAELDSVSGQSNVVLETKLIEVTGQNAELREQVEELTEKLARANETIETLSNGLIKDTTNTETDEDDDDLDQAELDAISKGIPDAEKLTAAQKKALAAGK